MVDGSGVVSAGDGAIPGGGSVGTSGAGGAGEGGAVAAPSNCVKEGAVESLPNDNTWRRPDDPVGDGRMLSGLPGTAAGLCFFLRNSSLRLAFLLMVDGLFFFQALSLVTEVGAISLVSREMLLSIARSGNSVMERVLVKSMSSVLSRPFQLPTLNRYYEQSAASGL